MTSGYGMGQSYGLADTSVGNLFHYLQPGVSTRSTAYLNNVNQEHKFQGNDFENATRSGRVRDGPTIVLSKKIKNWIREFRANCAASPFEGIIGGQHWQGDLLQYLEQRDGRIKSSDVQRWVNTHRWISQPFDHNNEINSPPIPPDVRPPPRPASAGPPASPVVGSSTSPQMPERNSVHKLVDENAKLSKIIYDLRDQVSQRQDLRVGADYCQSLLAMIQRSSSRALRGKTRQELLMDDLHKGGLIKIDPDQPDPEDDWESSGGFSHVDTVQLSP